MESPLQYLSSKLYQRNNSGPWWVRFSHLGRQYRFATYETDKVKAAARAAEYMADPEAAAAKVRVQKVTFGDGRDDKGLYQRGKIWWVNFTYDGKRLFLPTGKEDYAEALIVARAYRANPPVVAPSPLKAEVEHFCASRTSNYGRDSKYVLLKFIEFLDSPEPRAITAEKIQKWVSRQEVKPNTREAYRYQIQKFLDHLITQGKARRNPALEVSLETESRSTRVNWIHRDQYPAIYALTNDLELRFALYCGFEAGLRKEEVIMCRPDWIDREVGDYGVLHVKHAANWQSKDRTERTIPLSPEFREFLDHGFPRLPGPYMIAPFKEKAAGDRYRVNFRTKFENLVASYVKAGGKHFTFHDARRSFASNLVTAGVSLYKVAKYLGDDPDVVSATYGHLDPNDTDLARVFGRKSGPSSDKKVIQFK